jgi:phosphatidylserine synthase
LPPDFFTYLACLSGLSIIPLLAFGYSITAFAMLTLSGFLDTVDGSIARLLKISSPRGAALDIVSDRIVEFAIILGLYTIDPATRGLPAILMLGSILICVTSFLIVGVFTEKDSEKSFYYSPGLIERAEAFIFFALMILFPSIFTIASYLFSFLVFITAALRMRQFMTQFART